MKSSRPRPRKPTRHWQCEPPSRWLLALESCAVLEWSAWLLTWPWLGRAPRGDGHPVLVLPGLVTGDNGTWPLRHFLDRCGFKSYPWELGINRGPVKGTLSKLGERIRTIEKQAGCKLSLVGWSLGGAMAHHLARTMPERIRTVITLGSPLDGHPYSSNAWRLFEQVSGLKADDKRLHGLLGKAPRVPTTNILSKSDGIVHWRTSMLPPCGRSENIEVSATHLGLGVNPIVLWMIAERLAQTEGQWKPFERKGPWHSVLYRDPEAVDTDHNGAR